MPAEVDAYAPRYSSANHSVEPLVRVVWDVWRTSLCAVAHDGRGAPTVSTPAEGCAAENDVLPRALWWSAWGAGSSGIADLCRSERERIVWAASPPASMLIARGELALRVGVICGANSRWRASASFFCAAREPGAHPETLSNQKVKQAA